MVCNHEAAGAEPVESTEEIIMDNLQRPITIGSFVRLKGENTRYFVLTLTEHGANLLRTYNRDPKKWYIRFEQLEEIISVEVPKVRVQIFKEAFQNFFEKHGNFWFDNLTYIEILDKLTNLND